MLILLTLLSNLLISVHKNMYKFNISSQKHVKNHEQSYKHHQEIKKDIYIYIFFFNAKYANASAIRYHAALITDQLIIS